MLDTQTNTIEQNETSLVIRPAAWKDKNRLLDMIEELARLQGDHPEIDIRILVDLLKADMPWLRLIVAEANGELVGYASVTGSMRLHFGQRVLDLHHLFVAKEHRGKGYARALIERARLMAIASGCARMTVSTAADNLKAQSAYLACGFKPLKNTAKLYEMHLD